MNLQKYEKLFESVNIGKVTLKNRFAMAPMGPLGLADAEGGFNQRGIDYYTERAKGGTGLIMTGVTFVDNEVEEHGMPNCPCSTHNPVHFIRSSREMTERIHAYNSKIFLMMSAGFGRVTIPTNLGDYPPVAPSPIMHRWLDRICRELSVDEIHTIVKKFGDGAFNAKRAGFDGIAIHAVHEGYLLDQFAISLFNHRTDEYGGCLENRLRFAREVVEEIKKRCGADFPVVLRYSPKSFIKDLRVGALPDEEFEEKGRDLEEGKEAAKLLVSYGYDALDVDVGSYDAWWWNHPPMYQKKGLFIPYAQMIKELVDVPVFCAGRMDDPDMALKAVEDGACDIISLGRPLLADPDYVNKLRSDNTQLIRPCLSCQEGCMGRIQEYSAINCAVNPSCGRERYTRLYPALNPKKILIAGGGPAGCEAARVLALRGHKPILCEASGRLGGNLIPGGAPEFKEDDLKLVEWYENTLKELGVEIRFNTTVDTDYALRSGADGVIVAAGAKAKVLRLGDDSKTFAADTILRGNAESGSTVAIIGGGLVGCETALWLSQHGKKVTIIEALDKILALNGPLCHANSEMLLALIPFNGIDIICSASAKEVNKEGLVIEKDGELKTIPAETVIYCVGYRSESSLYDELSAKIPYVWKVGDCKNVANVMYAIWDAFELASHIDI